MIAHTNTGRVPEWSHIINSILHLKSLFQKSCSVGDILRSIWPRTTLFNIISPAVSIVPNS